MNQSVLETATASDRSMDLLRFATAGSVDDGKSTLIGRLLHDTKAIFADQLEAVQAASAARGDEYTNLALLTDGLRAEREQGITIDVAYRYFATPRRKFIIADTPGHIQYTRNMVTGASTADLALILIDARKGLVEQSRRHAFLCSLLRVPHLVLCVNKMDLVGWDRDVFTRIAGEFAQFAARLEVPDLQAVPVSALTGDNIVSRSDKSPWYEGPPLLQHLEQVQTATNRNFDDVRFPVQHVIRPLPGAADEYRGFAGQVASGIVRLGDEVMVLPSGRISTISGIDTADGPVDLAFPPMSVALRLAGQIDVERGDLICRPDDAPAVARDLEALICWMDESQPLRAGASYAVKHTTRTTRAVVQALRYRLDVNTLDHDETATGLFSNDIGRVRLRTTEPLLADPYRRNRTTGGFILIDESTNRTAAAGMIAEMGPE